MTVIEWRDEPMPKKREPDRRVTIYRSSKTGRLVTRDYARRHPATTEKQRVRVAPLDALRRGGASRGRAR